MTRIALIFILAPLTAALLSSACSRGDARDQPPAATSGATAEVTYEPAYPEDVSAEGLSETDREQQEVHHSHGGEEHTHGEGDAHDDDGHDH